jgi:hypothetical protein
MATRMQQRRGTAAQWVQANPVLHTGEIGFETDTNQFKIGDGVNRWEDIDYFLNSGEVDAILGDFIPLSEKGEANGVATLDVDGQVPADQLGNATVDLSSYATEAYADAAEASAISAAEGYTDTAVANLVQSAPETLDTLNELAAALGDDPNFATTVTNQIGTKQATITGAATTITSDNLTVSRALASDGSGKVAVSSVTATELGHLSGVTSVIQTQINNRSPLAGSTSITTVGTVTTATSPTAAGSTGLRKITISTSDPSGGADGDVWLKYTP